jgi:SNF2 family DNA or RNA helicase
MRGLMAINWGRIALDEGHRIDNPETDTSKAVYGLRAEERWVLRETPVKQEYQIAQPLLHFLRIKPWDNVDYFKQVFIKKQTKTGRYPVVTGERNDVLAISFRALVIRLKTTDLFEVDKRARFKLSQWKKDNLENCLNGAA